MFHKITPSGHRIYSFAGIEFVKVPGGTFLMGDNDIPDAKPQHEVNIPYDYWISRFPVTNAQYARFAKKTSSFKIPKGKNSYPVNSVSWTEAQDFILELNLYRRTDSVFFRLPSEAEWEKAARGIDGRNFPWGDKYEEDRCNVFNHSDSRVGAHSPQGDSPYGAADMVMSVWQWTRSLYRPYPYIPDDGREDDTTSFDFHKGRVLRGCAYNHLYNYGGRVAVRMEVHRFTFSAGLCTGIRMVALPRS